jgi:hypothetical protein
VATRVALVAALALSAAAGSAPAARVRPAPQLLDLRVSNGSTPFAGDGRLLTTVSPNGDGFRDRAIVRFRLLGAATVELDVLATVHVKHEEGVVQRIWSKRARLRAGRHRLVWTPPASTPEGTYVIELTVTDSQGRRRIYGNVPTGGRVLVSAPVVRIQRIDAWLHPSYRPGQAAVVSIATDARTLGVEVLAYTGGSGQPDPKTLARPLTPPAVLAWAGHRNAPGTFRIEIGDWPSGLYFARITARDGRVGYAPFVVRPRKLGTSRIAVVLPTNTWQAYNFEDLNGDGWGDSWYIDGAIRKVNTRRPYVDFGVPFRYRDFDAAIMSWVSTRGQSVDFLTDADLSRFTSGDQLARNYDLLVFPGHEEYDTSHEYDLIGRFRDLGGNLMFLSANNLFWKVVLNRGVMRRVGEWRNLGRPEAGVVGVQYVASNEGAHQAPYTVADTASAPWAFEGTGLQTGSQFGRYGIEIDKRAAASPPGTIVLASSPDLAGPGRTAEMTYYETARGAKVFAAGAINFGASVDEPPVARLLENVWERLSRP